MSWSLRLSPQSFLLFGFFHRLGGSSTIHPITREPSTHSSLHSYHSALVLSHHAFTPSPSTKQRQQLSPKQQPQMQYSHSVNSVPNRHQPTRIKTPNPKNDDTNSFCELVLAYRQTCLFSRPFGGTTGGRAGGAGD